MTDWMMGGVVENDREEARSAARFAEEPDDDRPSASDLAEDDLPERDEENACPECPTGVVVQAGPMEWDTGHVPYGCTRCSYGG